MHGSSFHALTSPLQWLLVVAYPLIIAVALDGFNDVEKVTTNLTRALGGMLSAIYSSRRPFPGRNSL